MDYILELDSLLHDSSSDDELEIISTFAMVKELLDSEGGSRSRRDSGRRRNTIWHNSLQGKENLFCHYFAESPVFPPKKFRRRFRMRRDLFMRIHDTIISHDRYFVQRRNAAKKLRHSSLQKMITAIRMLTYGVTSNFMDEYLWIGETTAIDSFVRFVKVVVSIFSAKYFRSPNPKDIARLLAIGENRGFPGMLGSIDCMHWKWKNCPNAWRGIYSGHIHEPAIILEAMASHDLWMWHAFFGLPEFHNDINVLERSNVFANLAEGHAPSVNYSVNGHDYTMGYYLADAQESARKDVEQAFGVLQARFAIVHGPARLYQPELLKDIMMACIILHNMTVEDERGLYLGADEFDNEQITDIPFEPPSHEHTDEIVDFMQNRHCIRDQETHSQLQSDLIEHLWQIHSQS
ncbi:uncharacterized protein LOC133876188 [Alnus glutinosa]|uniref:uncharacterized protein LOC133876188 n=1 Tax=Alnus glutinosa TaxID=3517 RepID=UPI002D786D46|nr:uncharacterized protein LOC133876188 [Alnus glutinosa]